MVRYIPDIAVRELLSIEESLDIIEKVYRDQGMGKAVLSSPSSLELKGIGDDVSFKIKGAFVSNQGVAGFRLIGIGKSGPAGFICLCDPHTTRPVAIIDESWQYLVRSGLTAAISSKYLARTDSESLGLIGCGRIAPYVLMGLERVFPLKEVKVSSRRVESRMRFSAQMTKSTGLAVSPVHSVQEAVKDADIIVSVSSADEPLIHPEWIKKGAFICSQGGGQELDDQMLDWADKFVVDDFNSCLHAGDISAWIRKGLRNAKELRSRLHGEIGEIAAKKKVGRERVDENILGIVQGMASCDIALAKYVYDRSSEKGLGISWEL